ncbi:MAG: FMN-binding negative transcriptional regulator [Balneolaceae bacterium]
MYNPKPFQIEDLATITEFVEANSLATIISSTESYPLVSHTPLLINEKDGIYFLRGHLSKANAHTRSLKDLGTVLAIFQGAQGYVSSYAKDPMNLSILPTWNYEIVHAKGKISLMNNEELRQFMHDLTNSFEKGQPKRIDLSKYPKSEFDKKLKMIMGFSIEVQQWEGCFRLSQNRSSEIQKNIKVHLSGNKPLVKAMDKANPQPE